MKTLGSIRKEKGLTQQQLAEAVGVTKRAIASYESGSRRPSPAVAERIARVLGMDLETMWRVLYRQEGLSPIPTVAGTRTNEHGGRVHE
mgnify:CR=1 FL=1